MSVTPGSLEAIIFLHGYTGGKARGYALRKYIEAQISRNRSDVTTAPAAAVGGCPGIELHLGDGRIVRAYEIPWEADVSYLTAGKDPLRKLWSAVGLAAYWGLSPIWKSLLESWYMASMLLMNGILMLIWIAIAFHAAFPDVDPLAPVVAWVNVHNAHVAAFDHDVSSVWQTVSKQKWFAAVVASVLLATTLLLDDNVNVSDLFRRYLKQSPADSGAALDQSLRDSVIDAVAAITSSAKFGRVTVLGHSFGALLAVDAVASGRLAPCGPMRLITLGAFFHLLALRDQRVDTTISRCLARPAAELTGWTEFWSKRDWSSTKTRAAGSRLESVEALRNLPWWAGVDPTTHVRYFADSAVIDTVLRP